MRSVQFSTNMKQFGVILEPINENIKLDKTALLAPRIELIINLR